MTAEWQLRHGHQCKLRFHIYFTVSAIMAQNFELHLFNYLFRLWVQYVGPTKNKLLTRFNSHYCDIQHNSDTTVARHFNKCPRDNLAKFEDLII